ncbi:MAG: hypothetical protein HOV92_12750 [Streptomyces sp.]|nr:hypothetical protein [Streptomyces sp.]
MTDQPSSSIAGRVRNAIGPTMLLGLQDAELYDEPGAERIREWVAWIADAITPIIDAEVQGQVDRIRVAVTEGKHLGRALTASDVMVAHEVTRKQLATALDAGLHLNWPQLVEEARRSMAANAAWFQDVQRVRDLHVPDENGECRGCHASYDPCPTIAALENKEPTTCEP